MCVRDRWQWGGVALPFFVVLAALSAPAPAAACGGPAPLAPVGVPKPGAMGVSTATSIVMLSQGQPAGLALQAGGMDVPLSEPVNLGIGENGNGFTGGLSFWRIRAATADGMLVAGAEHVLKATFQGASTEVTRFTTAAGYDKVQGVAPVARGLHLWRVRYPLSEIASGDCVFAEYHGFVTVDYDPATIPNTPPSSVVHTFQLAPKTGGSAQTFNYVGGAPFVGLEPKGDHPLPLGSWQPELDPTREYCLTISAFGDGDIARLALSSQPTCATVVQLSSAGAPASPGTSNGSGGGCSVAGDGAAGLTAFLASILLAGLAAIRRSPSRECLSSSRSNRGGLLR